MVLNPGTGNNSHGPPLLSSCRTCLRSKFYAIVPPPFYILDYANKMVSSIFESHFLIFDMLTTSKTAVNSQARITDVIQMITVVSSPRDLSDSHFVSFAHLKCWVCKHWSGGHGACGTSSGTHASTYATRSELIDS